MAGRKGAAVTNKKKRLLTQERDAVVKRREAELKDADMVERAVAANEHVVPIDDTEIGRQFLGIEPSGIFQWDP